jgi:hypothetical protein
MSARPETFMPENTNADNRSRDRARPGYLRFQAWVKGRYPNLSTNVLPRWTYQETENHLRCVLGENAARMVYRKRDRQREDYEAKKAWNAAWGRLPVRTVFGEVSDEDAGRIIERMQMYLPSKVDRTRFTSASIPPIAESAAFRAGTALGFKAIIQ